MAKPEQKVERIPVTVDLDQSLFADYQLMVDEINRECDCGKVHTLTEFFEADMRELLRRYHITRIQQKYGPKQ